MSMVAPKGRQPLAAEALFRLVCHGFARLGDDRADEPAIACTDALRSAFAMVSLPSPSLRALDQERGAGHGPTIDGMAHAPGDTSRRERIDPVFPASRRPVCHDVVRPLQRGKAREPMLCLQGASVRARDGTGSCSSTTMHWTSCRPKVHRHGSLPSSHQLWGAAMIHPDCRAVMPLRPEPMVQLTFRTLFRSSEALLEEPPQERGSRAIPGLLHAPYPLGAMAFFPASPLPVTSEAPC
jgi:hypothetical protein